MTWSSAALAIPLLAAALPPGGAPDHGLRPLLSLLCACVLAGSALCAVGLLGLRSARRAAKSPAGGLGSARAGRVEIEGWAGAEPSLLSPITGTPCVYYRYSVERAVATERGTVWVPIEAGDSSGWPIAVVDASGRAVIDPHGAEVHLARERVWNAPRRTGWLDAFLRARRIDPPPDFRVTEAVLPPASPLFLRAVARPCGAPAADGPRVRRLRAELEASLDEEDPDDAQARWRAAGMNGYRRDLERWARRDLGRRLRAEERLALRDARPAARLSRRARRALAERTRAASATTRERCAREAPHTLRRLDAVAAGWKPATPEDEGGAPRDAELLLSCQLLAEREQPEDADALVIGADPLGRLPFLLHGRSRREVVGGAGAVTRLRLWGGGALAVGALLLLVLLAPDAAHLLDLAFGAGLLLGLAGGSAALWLAAERLRARRAGTAWVLVGAAYALALALSRLTAVPVALPELIGAGATTGLFLALCGTPCIRRRHPRRGHPRR